MIAEVRMMEAKSVQKSKTTFIHGKGKDIFESVDMLLNERQVTSTKVSKEIRNIAFNRLYELLKTESEQINESLIRDIRNGISSSNKHIYTWEECVDCGKKYTKLKNLNVLNSEFLTCDLALTFMPT